MWDRLATGAAVAAAVAAAGCGGGVRPPRGGAQMPRHRGDERLSGAAVFQTACRSCHSVIGNESRHLPGGDLLGYSFDRSALTQYTVEMPLRAPLSNAAVRAVVGYLLVVEQRSRHARGRHPGRPRVA